MTYRLRQQTSGSMTRVRTIDVIINLEKDCLVGIHP
jgi:hypothetical protein